MMNIAAAVVAAATVKIAIAKIHKKRINIEIKYNRESKRRR